jgi:HAMP domain-containing protein
MTRTSRRTSIKWKIVSTFAGLITLFGILVVGIVYHLTGEALREQLQRQASAIAVNLSDVAAGHVLRRNGLELHALVTKYARLDGVAYTFIEDRKGQVLAHSLGTFPEELREPVTLDGQRQPHRRLIALHGKSVFETRMPLLEGQLGAVHVGIWTEIMEREVYRALFPVVGLIVVVFFVSLGVSWVLARSLVQPIVALTNVADQISKGNLDTPVGIDSRDELGALAFSLERMRASLKAAMLRLSRGSA